MAILERDQFISDYSYYVKLHGVARVGQKSTRVFPISYRETQNCPCPDLYLFPEMNQYFKSSPFDHPFPGKPFRGLWDIDIVCS